MALQYFHQEEHAKKIRRNWCERVTIEKARIVIELKLCDELVSKLRNMKERMYYKSY